MPRARRLGLQASVLDFTPLQSHNDTRPVGGCDVGPGAPQTGVRAFFLGHSTLRRAGDPWTMVNTMSPSRLLYSFWTTRAYLGGAQVRLVQVGLSLRPAAQFCAGIRSRRYTSTMSPTPANPVQSKTPKKALEPLEQVVGDSGRQYLIQKTLQEKEGYPCRVYLAT